ncbi:hypothetical protein HO831_00590 [Streptococcus suis]|uniref:Uncharacterized protein n=1 Tax=Streptococcus suis TaxID=1307 RepID=A0A822VGU9_STRSU|nr:hypothetical protein [Streptococcus suis]QBX21158.1 hypothetical protein Javan563_0039 [Streptococcus phage Javan563]QBX21278.1 hypothetical protein Javan567_0038 [Streptococcus phage Javan567]QBX21334.1 hypothetical protein Javan569_0039 [Streptococcus phage Javan569]AGZ23314.1 hypothetical protein T15_1223 [Streptococcus suis T15]MBO8083183.1 hypothetical protein [Streptococcus suis]
MNKQSTVNYLLTGLIILLILVSVGLIYRTEQLQEQVYSLQGQVNTYRVLIFNLYGKNGG